MSNPIRMILWSVLSLGMLFLAIMAFWVFLILFAVIIIARLIYAKVFRKSSGLTIQTYTFRSGPKSNNTPNPGAQGIPKDGGYTTVIDADDLDKEYKIPKIK